MNAVQVHLASPWPIVSEFVHKMIWGGSDIPCRRYKEQWLNMTSATVECTMMQMERILSSSFREH